MVPKASQHAGAEDDSRVLTCCQFDEIWVRLFSPANSSALQFSPILVYPEICSSERKIKAILFSYYFGLPNIIKI